MDAFVESCKLHDDNALGIDLPRLRPLIPVWPEAWVGVPRTGRRTAERIFSTLAGIPNPLILPVGQGIGSVAIGKGTVGRFRIRSPLAIE